MDCCKLSWCILGWQYHGSNAIREGVRERDRDKERQSGRHMALGVSAQLFPGAVAAIHLDTACSALASELSPLGLSGPLRMNSERKEEVKRQE